MRLVRFFTVLNTSPMMTQNIDFNLILCTLSLIALALLIAFSTLATGNYVGFFRNLLQFSWLIVPIVIMIILTPMWPNIKGAIGERRVRIQLAMLNPEKYKVLHNVFLRMNDGRTTQIDHVIIAETGIFVLETKNHTGWIFGSEKSEYWTQKIYRSNKKFKNPLHQNYGHIRALMEVMGMKSDDSFHSIVVFSGSAELKKMDAPNVLKLHQLLPYIQVEQNLLLSAEQITVFEGKFQVDFKSGVEIEVEI